MTGGLDGIMVGGYLTTGGRNPALDKQMASDLGRCVTGPETEI